MTWLKILDLVLLALVVAAATGAVAGIRLAGKDLGNTLASMMGGLFGPTAVVPAAVISLIALMWLK